MKRTLVVHHVLVHGRTRAAVESVCTDTQPEAT